MKKITFLSVCSVLAILLVTPIQAAVWRVNNTAGSSAHFSSIQAAHDAAQSGDTLYIEASSSSVGPLSAYKKLTIIGTGYFLAENPQTQASPLGSFLDYIYFYQGSEGSKVMGIQTSYIYLYANDIFITRNYFYYGSYCIYGLTSGLSNIIITQNYIDGTVWWATPLYFPSSANNILVSNNYIRGAVSTGSTFSGIFTNNIFDGGVGVYNSILKNNIFYVGSFINYNNTFTHNISSDASLGTQNGNQANVSMSTVFVGLTGNSTDGQWQLTTGSPAIGAGENGVDCGMFGGPFPYVLSGMPNIPSIYYLNAPAVPSNTIDVAIKAKSHN